MTLQGHVKNGAIVLDTPVVLPEGAAVQVLLEDSGNSVAATNCTLLDRLGDVVGAVDDLPADLAGNHDHYLYGTPKQS